MAKLLLIDGSNYLFRAFHGLPDLRTSGGEPTGALQGFFTMLTRVTSMVKPDRMAIVFDAKGKNFRHELFPDYKANRPPMPEDLRAQIEPLLEMLPKLGWPLIVVEGVEADDVIGTLTQVGRREGAEVVIATGDKDMAQLVGEGVTMLNTMNTKFYDAEGIREKYGVYPERIIDYLALMGDKVDNVPGIEKCGPKTAAKWIAQYGSLEGVVENAAGVTGKIGENLRRGLENLQRAKALVTIRLDCEVPGVGSLDDLSPRTPSPEAISLFSRRWEIREQTLVRTVPPAVRDQARTPEMTPLSELLAGTGGAPVGRPSAASAEGDNSGLIPPALEITEADFHGVLNMAPDPAPDEIPMKRVNSPEDIEALLHALGQERSEPVAVSLCWDGEARHGAPGALAFAVSPKEVYAVVTPGEDFWAAAAPWFASGARKVFYDVKSARHSLAVKGIAIGGLAEDLSLMHYMLEAHESHDLEKLAARYLRRTIPLRDDVLGKGKKRLALWAVDPAALSRLMAEEAAAIRALSSVFLSTLDCEPELRDLYENLERPLSDILFRMERTGVAIDEKLLAAEAKELTGRIAGLEEKAHTLAGGPFNLASPRELGQVLFEKLGIPVKKKTATGAPSTNEEVLSELALDYPLPKVVLEHRTLAKLLNTYVEKLPRMIDPVDHRVHTTFGQATAVTGRLASSDPNLQNIPARTPEGRRVREAFVGAPGTWIVSADYSQVELRVMAHLSRDKGLLDAFARGEDIHRATAAEVFGKTIGEVTPEERRLAKVINFGLIYGMSAFGLAQNLGVDRQTAAAYVDAYFAKYPGVKRFMERARARAHEAGHVETIFGRRLWIPDIRSPKVMVRSAAERGAVNAPVQGTAADIIKRAMILVDRWLTEEKLASRLLLQVHDELVLEVPEAELELVKTRVPELMAKAAELAVPLIAEVGAAPNWEAAH